MVEIIPRSSRGEGEGSGRPRAGGIAALTTHAADARAALATQNPSVLTLNEAADLLRDR